MPSESPTHQSNERTPKQRIYLRRHFVLYFSALVIWALAILLSTGNWSAFWPMITWSLVIMVHYLVVRSVSVDAEWIEKRTDQETDDAKDTSHIESIRNHYVRGIRPKTRVPPLGQTKVNKNRN